MSPSVSCEQMMPLAAFSDPLSSISITQALPKAAESVPRQHKWSEVLCVLQSAPSVVLGTAQELAEYQAFVYRCIEKAAELVAADSSWEACNQVLLTPLARALELVKAGKTSSGRALAVGLIGYAQLAEQLSEQLRSVGNATSLVNIGTSGQQQASSSATTSTTSSSTSTTGSINSTGSGEFKVPALPLKRQRSPGSDELLPPPTPTPAAAAPVPADKQQQRRHSAPKRRATPQAWAGGPICITSAAPPNSAMHGETVCDETLLAYWCPISGKRLKTDHSTQHQPDSPPAAENSSDASSSLTAQQQQPALDHQAVPAGSRQGWATQQQVVQQEARAAAAAAVPRASSTSTRSGSFMQHGRPAADAAAAAAAVPPSRAAVSSARSDAIEALERNMHEDPASKPSADVLLFNKAAQLPVVNWTGPIKHKASGRVVELCSLSLQVPDAFLEEFPGALYAAEIRHRKSVSLGRHVVCRASLAPLSEHQLAGLAAMARAQLVALCMLQTAELHLVPYFDNKNHVRCVGFLKVKA